MNSENKRECVFPMVIWPDVSMRQYRVNDHPYHAPEFIIPKIIRSGLVSIDLVGWVGVSFKIQPREAITPKITRNLF